jgi:hypothetical protein
MPVASAIAPPLTRDVDDFLQRHGAKEAFETICEMARDCYPDLEGMDFSLRDDPDVDTREWLAIEIRIPRSLACTKELRDRERSYHSRFVTEIPSCLCPLFTLGLRFTME